MNEQLMQLLQQWAKLEPDTCSNDCRNTYQINVLGFTYRLDAETASLPAQLMRLQTAIQDSIVVRGLRMELSNSEHGWHTRIITPTETKAIAAQHQEAAIALLDAYLKWLEAHQPQPEQAEGASNE